MSRRTRTRVAKGIYRDEYGLAGVVKVGIAQREKRYPFETDLDDIRQWQQETKGHLLLEHPTRSTHTRTTDPFNRSVSRYLALIEGRPGYASDRAHLAAWVDVFGDRPRGRLTSEDVLRSVN